MAEAIQFALALIAIGALFLWTDRGARPRRRIRLIHWLPFVVCSLWAFLGASQTAEGAVPTAPGLAARALPDQGFVIGDLDGDGHPELGLITSVGFGPKGVEYRTRILLDDLDGDGHPELASVISEGLGPRGVRYRIELHFTAQDLPHSISVSADRGGLRIVARDVDGDGDVDLVISSAESLTPVSVWINKGHGKGVEADPAAYARTLWAEGSELRSKTLQETGPAALLRLSQISLGFPSGSQYRIEFTSDDIASFPAAGTPLGPVISGLSTRSPPHFFRNWLSFSLGPYYLPHFIPSHIRILAVTACPQGRAVTGLSNRGPPRFLAHNQLSAVNLS